MTIEKQGDCPLCGRPETPFQDDPYNRRKVFNCPTCKVVELGAFAESAVAHWPAEHRARVAKLSASAAEGERMVIQEKREVVDGELRKHVSAKVEPWR